MVYETLMFGKVIEKHILPKCEYRWNNWYYMDEKIENLRSIKNNELFDLMQKNNIDLKKENLEAIKKIMLKKLKEVKLPEYKLIRTRKSNGEILTKKTYKNIKDVKQMLKFNSGWNDIVDTKII